MKKLSEISIFNQSPNLLDQRKKQEQVIHHPLIQNFRKDHPELSDALFRQFYPRLVQYIQEQNHCQNCPGLDHCPNLIQGHYPQLQEYAGNLDLHMSPCSLYKVEQERKRRLELIACYKIPKDIQAASLSRFEISNQERHEAVEAAIEFCQQIPTGQSSRGLYLYGPFGVGKSYIAGAIMNELARYGVGSIMIHTSELFGELRRSIQENRIQEKMEMLYSTPVLILDDIGSESLTPWIRDDVLSVLFHHRMADRPPTIYTSNLSLDELESYFSYTSKGGEELVKGMRIMERIRHSVRELPIDGPNRRYMHPR